MKKISPDKLTAKKIEMITMLEAHYGNVRRAAKVAGISTQTHYRWVKEDRDYGNQAEIIKDIGYRNVKDNLLELALIKAEKGDSMILGRLLAIFCKKMPEEMERLNRLNNLPPNVRIKYIDTREQAEEIMKREGRMPNS